MHSVIRVFSDRIEFQNPGRFAVNLKDNTGKVKSVPRNPNPFLSSVAGLIWADRKNLPIEGKGSTHLLILFIIK